MCLKEFQIPYNILDNIVIILLIDHREKGRLSVVIELTEMAVHIF